MPVKKSRELELYVRACDGMSGVIFGHESKAVYARCDDGNWCILPK